MSQAPQFNYDERTGYYSDATSGRALSPRPSIAPPQTRLALPVMERSSFLLSFPLFLLHVQVYV